MLRLPPNLDDSDRAILERADAVCRREFPANLTPVDLHKLHGKYGIDFATAVLYSHFAARLPFDLHAQDERPSLVRAQPPLIAVVPGAFYKQYPHLDADGRRFLEVASRRGWDCEVIAVNSLGTLSANAATIIDWFDTQDETDLIVVTISKGAADLRVALEKRPDLWPRIRGWICVSGILYGTPIADWLLDRKRFWLTIRAVLWYWNLPRQSLEELRSGGRPGSGGLTVPCTRLRSAPMRFAPACRDPIQIIGFPLRRHLSNWRSRMWHRRFQNYGPTDGVMWLGDLLSQPATVFPIWGADHYLRTTHEVTAALVRLVEWLAEDQPTTQCETAKRMTI
jgi:hypothetical protein